ncbi:MAG: D-alanyl-D-alanine carboxypeptidase [Ruminococcus sp.]|nr:D-alanyl-D-alanine carboxypeptidase [Ruminococcus sp.]
MLLCVVFGFSTVPFAADTYECDVTVTSSSVLVANIETDTIVYNKNIDTARFISHLSNIMTYIVARNNVSDISERVPIKASVVNAHDNSDTTLDKFIGKTLSVKDLLHYVMMTNGSDACYVLADYVTKGKEDKFVELMNKKARDLGCTKTRFSSPAAVNNSTQFSTCSDLYKIVLCALDTPDYTEIADTPTYIPDNYKDPKLTIGNTNSLLRAKSPYYFRHVKNGKYGYDVTAKGNIAAVSKYSDVSYVCIILNAQRLSEHNAFTETKQLLTWAYTSLDNKRVVSEETVIDTVYAQSSWGESKIELTTGEDIYMTMPAQFDESKVTFDYVELGAVELPVFYGQNMGTAKMYYDSDYVKDVDLIANTSDGIAMLEDLGSFANTMLESTLVSNDDSKSSKEKVPTASEPTPKNKKEATATQSGK